MKSLDSKLHEKNQSTKSQYKKTLVIVGVGGVFVAALVFAFIAVQNHLGPLGGDDVSVQTESAAEVKATGTEREDFMKESLLFDKAVQPILDNAEIETWDLVRHGELRKNKESALSFFASGQFSKALSTLRETSEDAKSLESEWNEAFEKELNTATSYFDEGDASRSLLYVSKALKIKPSNSDALLLKGRIDVLPEVSRLVRQLDIAKKENNAKKQVGVINDILSLDPERSELKQRRNQLITSLNESAFQGHIKRAVDAIDNKDAKSAAKYYEKAKSLYPGRSELKLLATKLSELDLATALTALYRAIDKSRAMDDWEGIQYLIKDAEAHYPNDPKILEAKKDASEILALKKTAVIFTSRPDRINDPSVRQSAMDYLRKAFPYASKSPSLKTAIKQINSTVVSAAKSYPVTIYSDNRTEIIIRRVGVVGKTKEKSLQMSPGVYQVEGKRNGYKTVMKTLHVTDNGNNYLEIEASERI